MPRLASHAVFVFVLGVVSACTQVPGGEEGESGTGTETGEMPGLAQETTWHQHIAPLMAESCGQCHSDGGIAPFSLGDYTSASAWAVLALEAVEKLEMPPYGADETEECTPRHGIKDDPRLSEHEVALLEDWILDGTLEGDPDTAAPLPSPPSVELEGADFRLQIPSEIEIEPGNDQFWCFVVDPELTETTFIDGLQVVPDNAKIVHHVLVYLDETSQSDSLVDENGRYPCFGGPGLNNTKLLAAWAPGAPPTETPEAVAMNIPAGAKFVMNIHYHPIGDTQVDATTSLDVRVEKGAPQYFGELALIGNLGGSQGAGMGLLPGPNDSTSNPEFRIPAGIDDHTETMVVRIPNSFPPVKIWSAASHMHYVGTQMLIGLERREPEEGTGLTKDCLINTPRYSFEWQRGYSYDAPLDEVPTALPGDLLYMRCRYNNSMSNSYVAEALAQQGLDAPVDVFLGEETLDEMCLGVFGVAYSIVP